MLILARASIVGAILGGLTPPACVGQAAATAIQAHLPSAGIPRPRPSRLFTLSAPVPVISDTASRTKDYHSEVGWAGAIVVGVTGALIGNDVCTTSDTPHATCAGSTIGFGLLGAAMGFVVGSMIGGLFPKG